MPDLHPQRYFRGDASRKRIAQQLYEQEKDTPLICPHGHVPPQLFADVPYQPGTPVDMFILPDHYVFRMLYSQGIRLESLGIPRRDNQSVEDDHRHIWQIFANHWYLFRGTPTGLWLREEWAGVFGITRKLTPRNAQDFYDELQENLQQDDFQPRRLYDRFNIETLCTTDSAADPLAHHQKIRDSDWSGAIRPTFRPDDVVHVERDGWRDNLTRLADLTDTTIHNYSSYITALQTRREQFQKMGAVATDHDVHQPHLTRLSKAKAALIFQNVLDGSASTEEQEAFKAHMLLEMAQMSVDDGLVMQLHIGSERNHNQPLYKAFGRDVGADIPHRRVNFTHGLKTLLNAHGNHHHFRLIVFTLDESTYSRELAPLAGHYPAMLVGPPWWFHDSPNGMQRYFERIIETAGLYNTAGFNDDTRAFFSIPARHTLWRRMSADWLAGLVTRHIIDEDDASEMMHDLAYGLAKRAYRLDG
jgi:glucuronate isomerase